MEQKTPLYCFAQRIQKEPYIAPAYAGLSQVAYNISSYPILWGSL